MAKAYREKHSARNASIQRTALQLHAIGFYPIRKLSAVMLGTLGNQIKGARHVHQLSCEPEASRTKP
jgi:hypothetical protein